MLDACHFHLEAYSSTADGPCRVWRHLGACHPPPQELSNLTEHFSQELHAEIVLEAERRQHVQDLLTKQLHGAVESKEAELTQVARCFLLKLCRRSTSFSVVLPVGALTCVRSCVPQAHDQALEVERKATAAARLQTRARFRTENRRMSMQLQEDHDRTLAVRLEEYTTDVQACRVHVVASHAEKMRLSALRCGFCASALH